MQNIPLLSHSYAGRALPTDCRCECCRAHISSHCWINSNKRIPSPKLSQQLPANDCHVQSDKMCSLFEELFKPLKW